MVGTDHGTSKIMEEDNYREIIEPRPRTRGGPIFRVYRKAREIKEQPVRKEESQGSVEPEKEKF